MLVHLVLITSIFVAFSSYKGQKLISPSFVLIGLFAVFRYEFGNDYSSYKRWYDHIKAGGESPYKGEFGFSLLNRISPSFFLIIATTTIFFLVVIYFLIKDNLDANFGSIAFLIFIINPYLFLVNLSAIRQCIALCIFIISLTFAKNKNFKIYVLLIILAALFHASAVLLIPVYFIINDRKITRIHALIIGVIMTVLLLADVLIETVLKTGLEIISRPDYIHYFNEGSSNSLRATILTGIYFVYVLINLKNLKGFHLICGKLYLFGLVFGVLAYHFAMFTRLQMYFDIFSIITIPAILQYHVNNDEGKVSRFFNLYAFPAIILLIYILRYISFFNNPIWKSFTSYHTIFEAIL